MTLGRAFWIASGANVAVALFLLGRLASNTLSRWEIFLGFLLLAFILSVGAMMGIVALIRRPAAYVLGILLSVIPPSVLGGLWLSEFLSTPAAASLRQGDGYFTAAGDRALAHVVVAGDPAGVAAALRGANPNARGWNGMTMMRLALTEGRGDPAVIAALLRGGADPDQGGQMLLGSVNDGVAAESGAMITGRDERMLRAVIEAGLDLNRRDPQGQPRFFTAIRWPEGLALMLDHGADVDARDRDGNSAVMMATMLWHWPAVELLLARGARLDGVNSGGFGLRDYATEAAARLRASGSEIPPALAALEARLN